MNSLTVELFKARDAEDSHALACQGDPKGKWRAVTGFGSDFQRVWTVEYQSALPPDLSAINWNNLLERTLQAAELSDPLVTGYEWPVSASL